VVSQCCGGIEGVCIGYGSGDNTMKSKGLSEERFALQQLPLHTPLNHTINWFKALLVNCVKGKSQDKAFIIINICFN